MSGLVSTTFPAAGLESARPTSVGTNPAFYSATDTGVVWRSDDFGATWNVWALALPPGVTDGDVPVWDATSGLWVPGAGGGGGGGAGGPSIDSLTDYNAAFGSTFTGADQEFDRTGSPSALPSGASWVNQGTATYVERFGAGIIAHPGAAGDDVKAVVSSLSGAPSTWRAVAKISYAKHDVNYEDAGLVLRESSSGKLVTFAHVSTGSATDGGTTGIFGANKYTNPTTYNALLGSRARVAGPMGAPIYMAIDKQSSTSWRFQVSPDGVAWYTITTQDVSAFMTPDQIGFGASLVAGGAGDVACHWLRVR